MKAVVVEIKENKAAVLVDDGRVIAINNKAYEVGQILQIKEPRIHIAKQLSIYAASAAAVMILGVGSWAYAAPYTYVSVDVNPSIEYSVNRFDRVLSVKAVNDDGEEIIQKMDLKDLKNKSIESALLMTMEQITEAGYFTGDTEGGIVITTASENIEKADELATSLEQAVEEEFDQSEETVEVESYSVGLERVEEAKELGVTPGKLNLVEKLQASSADPASVDINQWLNKPVKEIMKATKDNKKNIEADVQDESSEDNNPSKAQAKEEREEQKQKEKADKVNDRSEDQTNINDNSSDMDQSDNSQEPSDQLKDNNSTNNSDKNKSTEKNNKNSIKDNKINNGTDKMDSSEQTEQKQDKVTSTKEKKSEPSDSKITKDNEKKNKENPLTSKDNNITDTNTETDRNSAADTSMEQNNDDLPKEDDLEDNGSVSSEDQSDTSKAAMNSGSESGSTPIVDKGNSDSGNANSHK